MVARRILNKHNLEAGSNTPDYIPANYLIACLKIFDEAVNTRTSWYSKEPEVKILF